MGVYNLERLGWFNFESLIRCLSREVIGNGLSTFSGSQDQGRDATFHGKASRFPSDTESWDGDWILQVKHRQYSSRGARIVRQELATTLEKEIDGILKKHRFPCNNYLFITNCPLSAADKDDLIKRVQTFKIDNIAVLGEADVEELLNNHARVVSAFPQILGLGQLKHLTNWGLHTRSSLYLEAAQDDIAVFVATRSYLDALELLHGNDFCVLTGPPKMGKTCTANALAGAFGVLGYEIYELRDQRDFYDAFTSDEKQLFICDDVFGDIALNTSRRDDWTHGFLRLLRSLNKEHKLIWTARSYILREAIESSRLREERADLAKADTVTVAVDRLSRMERAMILYNHAKNSQLPPPIVEFLRGDACVSIVDHTCYAPETIRQLCSERIARFGKESSGDTAKLYAKIDHFLYEPGDAWKNAYRSAPQEEQLLCTEVMAAGGEILKSELENRYNKAISLFSRTSALAFKPALSSASGTFLRIKMSRRGEQIEFYHPSMRDLMIDLCREDKAMRGKYLQLLELKEVPSLFKEDIEEKPGDSSAHHRVDVDKDDIGLVEKHLKENLLPKALLDDIITVLAQTRSATKSRMKHRGRRDAQSATLDHILQMILDTVASYACGVDFWETNKETTSFRPWRQLFEILRELLPLTSESIVPAYTDHLLRKDKDDTDTDFWGLVVAIQSIAPIIVARHVDLENRRECRQKLEQNVEAALAFADSYDIEGDYDDSNEWHDNYEWIPEDCADYESIFPDDIPIDGWDDLESTMESHPRIELDADYDIDVGFGSGADSSGEDDVKALFADL